MEAIQYMKSHKDESLKIFSKYVRNPDLSIMAYLYEEIASRVEPGLRPQADAVRAMLDLAAQDFPQAKRLSEKDNWDLSLIDEIQSPGLWISFMARVAEPRSVASRRLIGGSLRGEKIANPKSVIPACFKRESSPIRTWTPDKNIRG